MPVNSLPMGALSFEVFDNNNKRLLGIASVDLPELSLKTVEVAGASILGSMDYPLFAQAENLELTLHFRVLYEDAATMMTNSAQFLTCYVASEHYDAGDGTRAIQGLKIVARGLAKSTNLGKLEVGENSDTEVVLHLDYLKISANGDALIEFDRFNYIYNVDGQDLMTDYLAALGL
ncbi:MAG: phage major tail tube protein [Selenomonadaceae bacterium]|nr:phage major tail tube protein [Selenomonadaceae bacterium]